MNTVKVQSILNEALNLRLSSMVQVEAQLKDATYAVRCFEGILQLRAAFDLCAHCDTKPHFPSIPILQRSLFRFSEREAGSGTRPESGRRIRDVQDAFA
jgi:hypothetical protein